MKVKKKAYKNKTTNLISYQFNRNTESPHRYKIAIMNNLIGTTRLMNKNDFNHISDKQIKLNLEKLKTNNNRNDKNVKDNIKVFYGN